MRSFNRILLFIGVLILASCKKEKSNESGEEPIFGFFTLAFESVVANEPLVMGTSYTNNWGETYSVNRFQYYIHGIELQRLNGTWRSVDLKEHYLIDDEKPETKILGFNTWVGDYQSIRFIIGVDSIRNYSGDQTGALDPLNGMFWAWTSGYVFAKLEGNSSYVNAPRDAFTYHVGGYKAPNIAFRTITLPFEGSGPLTVEKELNKTIAIEADINTWFHRIHPIKLSENYACHSPGSLANSLADNYEGMFQVRSIQ